MPVESPHNPDDLVVIAQVYEHLRVVLYRPQQD